MRSISICCIRGLGEEELAKVEMASCASLVKPTNKPALQQTQADSREQTVYICIIVLLQHQNLRENSLK